MRPKHSDCYDGVFTRKTGIKRRKRGYGECEIVLILEQNIVARFVCINEYGHPVPRKKTGEGLLHGRKDCQTDAFLASLCPLHQFANCFTATFP